MITVDGYIICADRLRQAVSLIEQNRHMPLKKLAGSIGCAITTAQRYRTAALDVLSSRSAAPSPAAQKEGGADA